MTEDRVILNKLKAQESEIKDKIQSITIHPCGKTYGQMISKLIYEYVDYITQGQSLRSWEIYKIYSKIHYSISSKIGVKTKVFTKEEYLIALQLFSEQYKFGIKQEYMIKEVLDVN